MTSHDITENAKVDDVGRCSNTNCASGISTKIPRIFCWTKMGSEAGQTLSDILRRKELERRAGKGVFGWGIGSSLGDALQYVLRECSEEGVQILFTQMKSKPRVIDQSPSSIVLWMSYWTDAGHVKPLPDHIVITSRKENPTGSLKTKHYALICSSKKDITGMKEPGTICSSHARNIVSMKQVGASQVTAMVKYCDREPRSTKSDYPVAFQASFVEPGFVKLAHPVTIEGKLAELYDALCTVESKNEWVMASTALKAAAQKSAGIADLQTRV